jgi:hypothetical protein
MKRTVIPRRPLFARQNESQHGWYSVRLKAKEIPGKAHCAGSQNHPKAAVSTAVGPPRPKSPCTKMELAGIAGPDGGEGGGKMATDRRNLY